MGADMHIHVITDDFTEEDYKIFESSTIGSKYFRYKIGERDKNFTDLALSCEATPHVWVGEVSWLKAALFEDNDKYIPNTVWAFAEIIGEDFPTIDDDLIKQIEEAFELENNTVRPDGVFEGKGYSLADKDNVVRFLKSHMGEKVFTVSW